jgi:amino acid permease
MKVFEDVLASYGVYVTTILTFLFGKRTGVESRPRFLGWLAIAVTFVWVAVFTILLVGCVFFRWFDVDDHAEVLEQWAKATALIVTPLIAYYFSLDREQQP